MIVHRLPARAPGWVEEADVVVVGSGVAGLTVALRVRARAAAHGGRGPRVLLVTKDRLGDGSTRWAQGGIAAALGLGDTPHQHLRDTLVAGAGTCDVDAVRALVSEGPDAVHRLIAAGAAFDRGADGEIALTREGGHLRRRIAHAGGDATGAEISRALLAALRADDSVRVVEHALALDLLTDPDGRTAGITLHVMGEGEHDGTGAVHAPAVVLATGGIGQVYAATTNPAVSTGDGLALALRAGADVADLEFVQFHPTVLHLGPDSRGRQPLISEAVRGEGARLVDGDGVRFMQGVHPLAELAPRDVVAKGITRRMRETGAPCAYLDARHFGAAMWTERFPTILAACRAHGIDPVTEPIPVSPAAHYASGGVRTDRRGRTTVPGLHACGEVACTGVHGANRLASNSLLEGLVFAERIADDLTDRFHRGDGAAPAAASPSVPHPHRAPSAPHPHRAPSADAARRAPATAARRPAAPAGAVPQPLLPDGARETLQRAMTLGAGVTRDEAGLAATGAALDELVAEPAKHPEPAQETWENANLHLVARALVAAATARRETRGCHWRTDHPERDDRAGRRRLTLRMDAAGGITVRPGAPLPPEPHT